jgi:hypothetical protein
VQYRRGGKESLKQHKAKGKIRTLKSDDLRWLQNVLQDSAIDHGFSTPLWTGTYVGCVPRVTFTTQRARDLPPSALNLYHPPR